MEGVSQRRVLPNNAGRGHAAWGIGGGTIAHCDNRIRGQNVPCIHMVIDGHHIVLRFGAMQAHQGSVEVSIHTLATIRASLTRLGFHNVPDFTTRTCLYTVICQTTFYH